MDGPSRPTAVICASDVLAYGARVERRAPGIAVPGAVSVVGFDDLQAPADMLSALTSLDVPLGEMGCRAAEHVLARFHGRDTPSQVSIETRPVVRDSTARPPGRVEPGAQGSWRARAGLRLSAPRQSARHPL